jgi:hypothetical protein
MVDDWDDDPPPRPRKDRTTCIEMNGSEPCDRDATRGPRCYAHDQRRYRKEPMSAPIAKRHMTPLERLCEAALAYADADVGDEGAWNRARVRLRKAAVAYNKYLRTGGK